MKVSPLINTLFHGRQRRGRLWWVCATDDVSRELRVLVLDGSNHYFPYGGAG